MTFGGIARWIVLLTSLLIPAASHAAEPGPCEFEAECQFRAWLDVFNAEDAKALGRFVISVFAAGDIAVPEQRNLRQRTGGYDLIRLEQRDDQAAVAIVRARSWQYYVRVTLEAEASKIRALRFLRVQPPEDIPAEVLPADTLAAELQRKFRTESEADRFSGAVMVTKDGITIAVFALG